MENSKLSEFLRNNMFYQVAHLNNDPAFKMFNISKTKVKLLCMKKEKRKKLKHKDRLTSNSYHRNKEKVRMIMATTTKTTNSTNKVNNTVIEATTVQVSKAEANINTKAILSYQAFLVLNCRE